MTDQLHVVTGALGYSGRYIAARLLAAGHRVRTLTNSSGRRNPFGRQLEILPLAWDEPARLAEALRGAEVLYNTYWVRFNHKAFTFAAAVRNSKTLFDAAARAGVKRIVHVSITNPAEDSDLEYFRGKAQVEKALRATGLPHTVLRPAVLFGGPDILVNNIAWGLRHVPVFGVFGDGQYRLQPIHVEDLAELALREGRATGTRLIDAIGPETFTYRGLAEEIARIIGVRRRIVRMNPRVGHAIAWCVGLVQRDVVVTWEEVLGLTRGLLCTDSPPAGTTRLTEWAAQHAATLGKHYASELSRRRDRESAYGEFK